MDGELVVTLTGTDRSGAAVAGVGEDRLVVPGGIPGERVRVRVLRPVGPAATIGAPAGDPPSPGSSRWRRRRPTASCPAAATPTRAAAAPGSTSRTRSSCGRRRPPLDVLLRKSMGKGAPRVLPTIGMPVGGDGMPWRFRQKAAFVFGRGPGRPRHGPLRPRHERRGPGRGVPRARRARQPHRLRPARRARRRVHPRGRRRHGRPRPPRGRAHEPRREGGGRDARRDARRPGAPGAAARPPRRRGEAGGARPQPARPAGALARRARVEAGRGHGARQGGGARARPSSSRRRPSSRRTWPPPPRSSGWWPRRCRERPACASSTSTAAAGSSRCRSRCAATRSPRSRRAARA